MAATVMHMWRASNTGWAKQTTGQCSLKASALHTLIEYCLSSEQGEFAPPLLWASGNLEIV